MDSFAIAAWLAVAPPGPSTRVGLAWHDQATVDAAQQQRLADAVANALGVPPEQVLGDAIVLARRLETYRLPADAAREISDLQARVDLAIAQFRAGDLQAASAQAELVLQRLRSRPGLPMASSMAWRLHVLEGRIAWTRADDAATEAAWRAAIAVDPRAQLSSREVPPDVIASYEAVRAQVLADRSAWAVPDFVGASVHGAEIEIDGIGGLRPVPSGEHFVVVHWPGAAAQAAVFTTEPIVLREPDVEIRPELPQTRAAADRICDRLELDLLISARIRGGRLGVQTYACGGDFAKPWYSEGPLADADDLSAVQAAEFSPGPDGLDRGVLLDPSPWPEPEPEPVLVEGPDLKPQPQPRAGQGDTITPKKPWFRRAWVWVLAGSLLAGAVTTGVVLGTREPSSSVVVTDDFLRP